MSWPVNSPSLQGEGGGRFADIVNDPGYMQGPGRIPPREAAK